MFSLFSPRLSTKTLSFWCRQVGISLNAGVSLLQALQTQAASASQGRRAQQIWYEVAESVQAGDPLDWALKQHAAAFPPIFLALIKVGESSGHTGDILLELADYYDKITSIKRALISSLIWPIAELLMALTVVGLLILVLGMLPAGENGQQPDTLGFGLVGVGGFIQYLMFLTLVIGGVVALFVFIRHHAAKFRPVVYFIDQLPKIGTVFRTLALTRLTHSLHLTLGTGMENGRAVKLSFEAAGYSPISDKRDTVLEYLEDGYFFWEAFQATGLYGEHGMLLVTHLKVGEEAGLIPETMEKFSKHLMAESIVRLKTLSVVAHIVVMCISMAIMVALIFKLSGAYLGAINNAISG